MTRIARTRGEGIDADLIETRCGDCQKRWCDCAEEPVGMCPGECGTELAGNGWCSSCEEYASEMRFPTLDEWRAENPEALTEVMRELFRPYSELKRTGTGGWL